MRIAAGASGEYVYSGRTFTTRSFTMHGTTMMFLFAVPMMEGVRGVSRAADARDAERCVSAAECPRLLDVSVRRSVPLSWVCLRTRDRTPGGSPIRRSRARSYSPGKRVDFWAQMITFTEISALIVAVELITTIFKMRAPGMSLNRMPMFVWAHARHSRSWSSSRCRR